MENFVVKQCSLFEMTKIYQPYLFLRDAKSDTLPMYAKA